MKKRTRTERSSASTVAKVPEREMWLYRNSEALGLLEKGLADAAAGRTTGAKDYSQFADLEVSEDE